VLRPFRLQSRHYSIQKDHVHFLIEAQGKKALADGMKSLGSRLAFTVNRVFKRRGSVLDGRYHHRILRSPREVRNGLAYVLLNSRKHYTQSHRKIPPVKLDVGSSGYWFDGWKRWPHQRYRSAGSRLPVRDRGHSLCLLQCR